MEILEFRCCLLFKNSECSKNVILGDTCSGLVLCVVLGQCSVGRLGQCNVVKQWDNVVSGNSGTIVVSESSGTM